MMKDKVYLVVSKWAQGLKKTLLIERCFVCGSLIKKDGEQFDPKTSDIDIVIQIPDIVKSECEIVEWLSKLKTHKQQLENELFVLLKRFDPNVPIVSIIPVTKEELFFDIHKSKNPHFFTSNKFKCLFSSLISDGIEGAGKKKLANELIRQVIEFCQKNRNEFLSNTIHGDLSLLEWKSEEDVLPKELMRHSAMVSEEAVTNPTSEEIFDTQVGLDHMFNHIYLRRHENPRFKELCNWLSVKRGARGDKTKTKVLSQDSNLFYPKYYLVWP